MLNRNLTSAGASKRQPVALTAALFAASLGFVSTANAGVITDSHGNQGYSTAAECDEAVLNGTAKFYKSFTFQPPLKRAGEASQEVVKLGNVDGYSNGACDRGVGRRHNRAGVSAKLIGTYVPYSPSMDVNAYSNANGEVVRLMMQQCDNNFSGPMPRPVPVASAPVAVAPVGVASDCFVDVLVPATFETRSEKVVKVPATKRYEVIPATYKTVTEKVIVQPETTRQIPVPATYKTTTQKVVVQPATVNRQPIKPTFKTVTEKLLVKPESTAIRVIPATYKTVPNRTIMREATKRLIPYAAEFETVTEKVKVAEGYKVWKRGSAWINQAIDVRKVPGSEDVLCLVEIPPQYETITRKKLKTPAGVREEVVPAEYCNCTKQVIDTPARTETIKIPAEYRTVKRVVVDNAAGVREVPVDAVYETVTRTVIDKPASFREERIPAVYDNLTRRVIDKPASTRTIDVPAQFETLSYRVKVSDARSERRQILCETNATPAKIKEIQAALKKAGFNPGSVDGYMRTNTMQAVNAFQKAKGLPVDGYLNIETVKALGVSAD